MSAAKPRREYQVGDTVLAPVKIVSVSGDVLTLEARNARFMSPAGEVMYPPPKAADGDGDGEGGSNPPPPTQGPGGPGGTPPGGGGD